MSNQIFKSNAKKTIFKIGDPPNIFNYNPTYSNESITDLINPRDMEVYVDKLFICEAGATTEVIEGNNVLKGVVIKSFQNPAVTIGYLNTYGSDKITVAAAPVGIALDLKNDFYYLVTTNTIAKWKITSYSGYIWSSTRISYFSPTGFTPPNTISLHDVTINNGIVYASGYFGTNMYYKKASDLALAWADDTNLTYNYSLISTLYSLDTIPYFFITDWGSKEVKVYKLKSDGTLTDLFYTIALPNFYMPYGIALTKEATGTKIYVSTNGTDYQYTGVIFKYNLTHNDDKTALISTADTEYRDKEDARTHTFGIHPINKSSSIPHNPAGIVADITRNRLLVAGRGATVMSPQVQTGLITFLKI